jgi:hypothetical protein
MPAFSQPIVLDGAKLGMEACGRGAPWTCAIPNAAPAQSRPAKIVRAAVRFLALVIGGNAEMEDLLIFNFYLRHDAWRKNINPICIRSGVANRNTLLRAHLGKSV